MANVPKVNGYSALYCKYCLQTLIDNYQVVYYPETSSIYLATQEQDFDINQVGVPAGFVPYTIDHLTFWYRSPQHPMLYCSNAAAFEFQRPNVDYGYIIAMFVLPDGVYAFNQEWGGTLTTGVDIFANDIPAFLPGDLKIGFNREII